MIFFFKEYSNEACIWYSDICDNICDISAFYFGADFPFNIGLYDNLFITCGLLYATCNGYFIKPIYIIKVITKLPNSKQSYKGKVKTHNYINRQNQSTTGKLKDLVFIFTRLRNYVHF